MFGTFFRWCQKPKNKYVQVNPVDVEEIEPVETEEIDPQILDLAEVKSLMQAAKEYKNGVMLPYFALAFLAGMRPKELARLHWQHLSLEEKVIRVGGDIAKLRQRRVVELEDNSIEWLRLCTGKPIVAKNWRRDFDAVRRAAGFRGCVSRKKQDKTLKEWPQDVLRHTSLSFHYAKHKDERATAAWAGNSPDTVHRFYRGLVTEAQAKLFWELKPSNVEGNTIPLPKAA